MRTRDRMAASGATFFVLAQLIMASPVRGVDAPATVTADMPSAVPAGRNWAFNDFFPRTVTVRTGADLQFINQGFHTLTLLTTGTTAKQDQHANGLAQSDTDDTSRNLNGTTHAVLNNAALGPTSSTCGAPAAPCSFDGSAVVSSGVPTGPPAPFVVHVAASPGTYVFLCRVHAGMTGKLKVVAASAEVPSATQVEHRVARQIAKDLKGAWAADRHASRDAEVEDHDRSRTWRVVAGTSSEDGRVALLEFLPKNLDIRPGDRVVFKPRSPNEPHTVTFPVDTGNEFVPLCEAGSTDLPLGPTGCNFGPPDEVELDGGNGVRLITSPSTSSDSGIIGARRLASDIGLARTAILNKWSVSFAGASAGTYTYVCMIHPGMEATISVH